LGNKALKIIRFLSNSFFSCETQTKRTRGKNEDEEEKDDNDDYLKKKKKN
jgi:hypothetical protein